MNDLKNLSKLVKEVLEEYPATRDSDDLLYLVVCKQINPSVDLFPFGTVIANLKSYNLPNIKSVERSRRRIQALHPELASKEKVKAMRSELEAEYRAFAKEEI